ncbi:MAG: 2-hydroxyacyl-CoA dehydratase [Deltaproteobacteria bacterium]|nr:2-hydroxyacyl-CoA dehydratase [Deltaproteobacteria bacterium]
MKQPVSLPRLINDIVDSPISPLVDKAQEADRKAIAYTCSFVPEPLLNVEGLFGVRVRAPGVSGTPMADTYLSNVICSTVRSILEFVLEGTFSSINGWVFTASCDHMRRLYDNLDYLEHPDFIHILDVPHKRSEAAVQWMREELSMLAEKLADKFNVVTDDAALSRAIDAHNEYLALMRDISDLRKRDHPPLTGAMFQALIAAASSSPTDLIIPHLRVFYETARNAPGIDDYRARLLMAGSHCDDPHYIRVIESTGALVVGDRTCTGSIPALAPIDDEGDPLTVLARRSLSNISCPRMMEEFDTRVEEIIAAAKEFRVDGVVLETMKFCDTWGVEASPMINALRKAKIPVLRLEREYSLGSEGQLQTRVQAFMESMGK